MLHVGDVSGVIRLTSSFDLSTASDLRIYYTKPSGATGYWTAALSGTTGIEYTTSSASDLDESGQWLFQGRATIGAWTGRSQMVTDEIGRIIEAS